MQTVQSNGETTRQHGRGLALSALAVLIGVATLCAYAQSDPLEAARNEFLHAYALPGEALQDSEALQAYSLYPYLEAARLEYALDVKPEINIDNLTQAFLKAHAREPVARGLRNTWLRSLAQRGDWPTFLTQYRRDDTEPVLRCQYLSASVNALQPEAAIGEAWKKELLEFYLTPRQLPNECESPFTWARQAGVITQDDIERRVRRLLQNDDPTFARNVAAQLSAERAAPLLQWAQLMQQPERSIDALIANPSQPAEDAALLAAWTKLARRNAPSALKRFESLTRTRHLSAEQTSTYALQLALGLSWNRHSEALAYFARVDAKDMDDFALAWKTRAALWAGDWPQATSAIAAMSSTQREETRWRYWAARVAEQTGQTEQAREAYTALLPKDNYYSAIAAARLGKQAHPHPEPLPANEAQLKVIESQPAFIRAHELLRCQLRRLAAAEWQDGIEGLDSALKPQTVHLASVWGWHDISITTAAQQRLFNDYALLYPRPFDEPVKTAAQLTSLELPLIYGVIRQESLFRPDAISPVGALGLTQLMPDTARRTARQWKQAKPNRADLFDPKVNVSLGAAQLRDLIDRFDGQVPVALAGYNAGPNAAQRWLPDTAKDPDVWIENIPYNETREYVQRVLWHSVVFAWLKNGEAQDTRGWLKEISAPSKKTL